MNWASASRYALPVTVAVAVLVVVAVAVEDGVDAAAGVADMRSASALAKRVAASATPRSALDCVAGDIWSCSCALDVALCAK
jgi:hypothetical protein